MLLSSGTKFESLHSDWEGKKIKAHVIVVVDSRWELGMHCSPVMNCVYCKQCTKMAFSAVQLGRQQV